jgi:hypothetical protein
MIATTNTVIFTPFLTRPLDGATSIGNFFSGVEIFLMSAMTYGAFTSGMNLQTTPTNSTFNAAIHALSGGLCRIPFSEVVSLGSEAKPRLREFLLGKGANRAV